MPMYIEDLLKARSARTRPLDDLVAQGFMTSRVGEAPMIDVPVYTNTNRGGNVFTTVSSKRIPDMTPVVAGADESLYGRYDRKIPAMLIEAKALGAAGDVKAAKSLVAEMDAMVAADQKQLASYAAYSGRDPLARKFAATAMGALNKPWATDPELIPLLDVRSNPRAIERAMMFAGVTPSSSYGKFIQEAVSSADPQKLEAVRAYDAEGDGVAARSLAAKGAPGKRTQAGLPSQSVGARPEDLFQHGLTVSSMNPVYQTLSIQDRARHDAEVYSLDAVSGNGFSAVLKKVQGLRGEQDPAAAKQWLTNDRQSLGAYARTVALETLPDGSQEINPTALRTVIAGLEGAVSAFGEKPGSGVQVSRIAQQAVQKSLLELSVPGQALDPKTVAFVAGVNARKIQRIALTDDQKRFDDDRGTLQALAGRIMGGPDAALSAGTSRMVGTELVPTTGGGDKQPQQVQLTGISLVPGKVQDAVSQVLVDMANTRASGAGQDLSKELKDGLTFRLRDVAKELDPMLTDEESIAAATTMTDRVVEGLKTGKPINITEIVRNQPKTEEPVAGPVPPPATGTAAPVAPTMGVGVQTVRIKDALRKSQPGAWDLMPGEAEENAPRRALAPIMADAQRLATAPESDYGKMIGQIDIRKFLDPNETAYQADRATAVKAAFKQAVLSQVGTGIIPDAVLDDAANIQYDEFKTVLQTMKPNSSSRVAPGDARPWAQGTIRDSFGDAFAKLLSERHQATGGGDVSFSRGPRLGSAREQIIGSLTQAVLGTATGGVKGEGMAAAISQYLRKQEVAKAAPAVETAATPGAAAPAKDSGNEALAKMHDHLSQMKASPALIEMLRPGSAQRSELSQGVRDVRMPLAPDDIDKTIVQPFIKTWRSGGFDSAVAAFDDLQGRFEKAKRGAEIAMSAHKSKMLAAQEAAAAQRVELNQLRIDENAGAL